MYFECDYMEGAHPEVLRRLVETNMEKTLGYGTDAYCEEAREKIRAACGAPEADVYFLAGGTQTNALVAYSFLKPCQGMISPVTGHVNHHESGAVEATGHKVIALPASEGKLSVAAVREYIESYWADENYQHIVEPGMVYLTHPTELGTLYTLPELTEFSELCRKFLFMWMGLGLGMPWLRMPTTFRCWIWHASAMPSTSAAPNAGQCLGRLWW